MALIFLEKNAVYVRSEEEGREQRGNRQRLAGKVEARKEIR